MGNDGLANVKTGEGKKSSAIVLPIVSIRPGPPALERLALAFACRIPKQ